MMTTTNTLLGFAITIVTIRMFDD